MIDVNEMTELPTGTVTFVFTDIELYAPHPDPRCRYRQALEQDRIPTTDRLSDASW